MIDVRLEAENHFRRRRISLRLRLRSLRKARSSLLHFGIRVQHVLNGLNVWNVLNRAPFQMAPLVMNSLIKSKDNC
jgi:hypothetical protein